MRAYFRVAPNFGVSMPLWMTLPLLILWASAALVFWFCVACWYLCAFVWMRGVLLWRAYRS